MTRARRAALLTAYVVATFLSFPHPVGGRVLDLGLLASWLSPALLLLGLEGLGPRRAARAAFVAGLAAQSAVLHWIYVVTVVYGHAPAVLGILAPVALSAYTAAFTSLFGAGRAWLCARGAAGPVAVALLWTALDHAKSFVLTGWPWATLGYAQHENPALLGLASLTGVYGLSFGVALGGAGLADALRHRRATPALGIAAAGVVALHALGFAAGGLRPDEPAEGATRIRVAALQGNIDQGVKWSAEWAEQTLSVYEDLTRRAAEAGAVVVAWPETAVPGSLDFDLDLRDRLARLARRTRAALIVGGVGIEVEPDGGGRRYFDSAYLFSPAGRVLARYDKSHLVPFGEYVPLRGLLGHLFRAVARGIADADVTSGPGPEVLPLPLPSGGGRPDAVLAGVPICYELLFPDLVRRFARDGAEVLFALTNDAWYGRTGAPYQFLAMTALRSAETGLWTVRAANTGVSAIIDARGRVREETTIFERGLLVADVSLRAPGAPATVYARVGDVFAWGCWAGAGALLLRARRRERGRK